jgi:hypothetical protein
MFSCAGVLSCASRDAASTANPIGNERSMRVEVRSVAPDANPYLVMLSVFKTGLDGETSKIKNLRQAERYLPDNIYDALDNFRKAFGNQAFRDALKHNAILIVPQGPREAADSSFGKMEDAGGFEKLVIDVVKFLHDEKKIPTTNIGHIVIKMSRGSGTSSARGCNFPDAG